MAETKIQSPVNNPSKPAGGASDAPPVPGGLNKSEAAAPSELELLKLQIARLAADLEQAKRKGGCSFLIEGTVPEGIKQYTREGGELVTAGTVEYEGGNNFIRFDHDDAKAFQPGDFVKVLCAVRKFGREQIPTPGQAVILEVNGVKYSRLAEKV